jgi:N-methylhydantoinase B
MNLHVAAHDDSAIDPVTLEIIRTSVQAIPDLIEVDLTRTAFSPLIYEFKDYAVGMVDAQGRSIALAQCGLPGFQVNLIGLAVQDALALYGEERIEPGDVLLTNYAAIQGQHLNNVVMYTPVFGPSDRVVAYMSVIVHWIDIGGRYPGSMGTDVTELAQEGLQLRTVKLYSRGERVEEIFRVIEYNTRQPDLLLGDIAAQHAGCIRGRMLFEELLARYGEETLFSAIHMVWRNSENAARAVIRAVPDGVYAAESFLDDDGVDIGKRIPIHIKVHVQGSDLIVDYSHIADQVRGPFNSGRHGGAEAAARIAYKYLFSPTEPSNHGVFEPLKLIIPPGKLVSAGPRAALGYYQTPLSTVVDTIIAAMAPAMPDRVAGGHHASFGGMTFSGVNPVTKRYSIYTDNAQGGWGGSMHGDGGGPYKTIRHADNRDIPVETVEALHPLLVERYESRQDSAGAGRHRGGFGVTKAFRILAPCDYTIALERFSCPPWGLFGGHAALPGFAEIEREDGSRQVVHKISGLALKPGDRVHVHTAGGGGYGSPLERSISAVCDDVIRGFISAQHAADVYGVLFTESGDVDELATEERRRHLGSADRAASQEKKVRIDNAMLMDGVIDRKRRILSRAPRYQRPLRLCLTALVVIAAAVGAASRAWAQDYPSQTIKVISSVSAGGTLDIFARAFADELQKRWGQPAIVDPRPGGNFTIAGRACASAPPDGYTVCVLTNETVVYSEFLNAKLPYDPRKDFVPVTNFFFNTMALVVNASLGVKNIDELAAIARAKPRTLSYLAPRVPEQVFFDRFNQQRGTDLVRIPFRGAGEAINMMLTGTVPIGFFGSSSFTPYVRQGTMVPLAVDGPSYLFPNTPTLEQLGHSGRHTRMWLGLLVPDGTPRPIIDKLNKVSTEMLNDPYFRQKHLLDRGMEPVGNTPQEFARFLEADRIATRALVKEAGLEP